MPDGLILSEIEGWLVAVKPSSGSRINPADFPEWQDGCL